MTISQKADLSPGGIDAKRQSFYNDAACLDKKTGRLKSANQSADIPNNDKNNDKMVSFSVHCMPFIDG
ncbi:MAG: hypothetical protein PVF37_02085 [Desulfobacterales bacterium]|jgi:hypothetical protein